MKAIRFNSDMRITLVIVPQDMRYGFRSLNILAMNCLGIDVSNEKDIVAFVSKRRNICKIIFSDSRGSGMIVRQLHSGAFQQILAKASDPAGQILSVEEFEKYINGEDIYAKKTSLVG